MLEDYCGSLLPIAIAKYKTPREALGRYAGKARRGFVTEARAFDSPSLALFFCFYFPVLK
jgi:hypothetical protein